VNPLSDGRTGSDRVNWLSKHGLSGFPVASKNFRRQNDEYDQHGSVFLPVYSQDSSITTSDFKVPFCSLFISLSCVFHIFFSMGLADIYQLLQSLSIVNVYVVYSFCVIVRFYECL